MNFLLQIEKTAAWGRPSLISSLIGDFGNSCLSKNFVVHLMFLNVNMQKV